MTVTEGYIKLVRAINDAKTEEEHRLKQAELRGYKFALERSGWDSLAMGNLIMAADSYYSARGIERPMCGGEFLDWEPAK